MAVRAACTAQKCKGRVYQRGISWYVDVWVRGERIRRSAGPTREEAEELIRTLLTKRPRARRTRGTPFDVVARHALDPGEAYLAVFRLTGTVAVLAYAFANIPNSIWRGTSWGTTLKFTFDGIVYGLVTAGAFGWLWPAAAA